MMFLRFWSTAYVQHLEAEIEYLRTERAKEAQRANIAVAELVRLKTDGHATIHPRPLMSDKEDDLRKELAGLMGDAEFSQAGS
jgi:hypothetical protein